MLKFPFVIAGFCLILIITSCTEKFDKNKWGGYSEVDGPDRDLMAGNLLKTHQLIGLTNKQMHQLLGPPANDTTSTWYELKEEWDMIDPVYSKYLIIKFNKDSVIIGAEIKEWHKH
jgi:hypothetical protein